MIMLTRERVLVFSIDLRNIRTNNVYKCMYDTYAWLFFLFSVLCRFDEKERIQKKSSKVTLDVLIVCFYHLRKKIF